MLASLWNPIRSSTFAETRATNIRLFSSGRIDHNRTLVKYHTDPEFRRRYLDHNAEYRKERRLRDPEYHKKANAQSKKCVSQNRNNEDFRRRETLLDWIKRSKSAQTDLPWKSYRPELYPERITHLCTGCNVRDYRARLWWCSTSDSAKYLCSRCWAKLNWNEACPEHFEDAKSWKEFTALAKELGTAKP
ncbi:uncharacterized protein M437DRAFT_57362 [Aureobasidium melanogenum CBS 110374]|uniref:Uncharacterized protein n=1 Tax=Aureobasidium melanogenum (strain CBS 110374) TaxID=1043003 RepID=A0A074W9S8_AURM1|nr:uncharacterized protein M437DRAFT_57362 [Aureobasidium melanogenum CBS 110374]KEQ59291.1 hypothetical protein M437DRAFT_57362 [Aureobasidium melanogenum CBS 110374]